MIFSLKHKNMPMDIYNNTFKKIVLSITNVALDVINYKKINFSKLQYIVKLDPRHNLPKSNKWTTNQKEEGSVLFIDMSGSVWNKLRDTPKYWQLNILLLHTRNKEIVKICKGKVSKTIGDCVMVYFSGENHKENAYLCAISLLETFSLIRRDHAIDPDNSLFKFPVTMGMAYGDLFFLGKNDPYGLAVDMAARLQSLANDGELLLYKDSYDSLDHEMKTFLKSYEPKLDTVDVKTFNEVEVYRITDKRNNEFNSN